MLKNLLRPKWQHPDPEVRIKALGQRGLEPEVLLELAVNDPVRAVRERAVAGLTDIGELVRLSGRRPELRASIAAALAPLLEPHDAGADCSERDLSGAVTLLSEEQQRSLLARAESVRLRLLAVERVSDIDALYERALQDPDIHVRKAAIGRIECPQTLTRIADHCRGTQLALVELIEQRIAALHALDAQTQRREAVLAALQAMIDGERPLTEPLWEKQQELWRELESDASEEQCVRFAAVTEVLAPLLEEQRQRRALDQARREQREQILDQLKQITQGLDTHQLDQAEIAVAMLERSWTELEPMHDHWAERRLQQRYVEESAATRRLLEDRRSQHRQERIVEPALERVERILAQARVSDKDLTEARQQVEAVDAGLKDKRSLAEQRQRLRNRVERVAQRLEEQRAEDKRRLHELTKRLDALERALGEQELRPALAAHHAAYELIKVFGDEPPPAVRSLAKRLHHSEPELHRLRSWADWGRDHAREELIDEAVGLQDAGLAVDELAKRLKQLRARWKALGRLGTGGKAQWERFDAACTQAHDAVKVHREQEQQQRRVHLQEREALCTEIEALTAATDWNNPDWRALDKALKQFRRRWREAGPVPHKAWKKVLDRYDAAVRAFDDQLEKERRRSFLQRQALVREAEQLAEQEDVRGAVHAAKELRGRWQLTVSSKPREERELWARFSKAMDAVFGRDREERDQFRAELNDHYQRGEALCARLEALADPDAPAIIDQRGEIAQIEAAFRELGEVPKQARRGLEQRFGQARERVAERLREAEADRLAQQMQRLYQRHRLSVRLESAVLAGGAVAAEELEALVAQWVAVPPAELEAATEQALQTRWERALTAARTPSDPIMLGDLAANRVERERICLDLEILLGKDSPPQAHAERMARQVELLQAAMTGREPDRADQARRLKLDYLAVGAVGEAGELEDRFTALFPLAVEG